MKFSSSGITSQYNTKTQYCLQECCDFLQFIRVISLHRFFDRRSLHRLHLFIQIDRVRRRKLFRRNSSAASLHPRGCDRNPFGERYRGSDSRSSRIHRPAAAGTAFAVNTRLHRPSSPLFARCRLAGVVYSVPPLRAAVKFSTLQSYEFVAANAIITAHVFVAPSAAAVAAVSYSFSIPRFFSPPPLFRPFPRFAMSSSPFDGYTALYDTRYPLSEILCPKLSLWSSYLRRRATYARAYTRRSHIESLVNFNFAN